MAWTAVPVLAVGNILTAAAWNVVVVQHGRLGLGRPFFQRWMDQHR